MSKFTAEIRKLLNDAAAKAEEFRDAIAEEIENGGEAAENDENLQNDLVAAEDIYGSILAAVDTLDEYFPEPVSDAA